MNYVLDSNRKARNFKKLSSAKVNMVEANGKGALIVEVEGEYWMAVLQQKKMYPMKVTSDV